MWNAQSNALDAHHQFLQFNIDLKDINSTLDDLSRKLQTVKGQYGNNLNEAKATSQTFEFFEKTIEVRLILFYFILNTYLLFVFF